MKKSLIFALLILTACGAASAAPSEPAAQSSSSTKNQKKETPAKIDYPGFVDLTQVAGEFRKQRLVNIDLFLKMAQDPQTMILDTRSASAYKRKHLKNAIHLNFSDFSVEKLQKTIPTIQTRILIYCNNNIEGDTANFPTKSMPLALNIPTFINLYGYGYKNIYELSSLLTADDPKLIFEGTDVK
jgi:hypothetical protein